MSTEFYIKDNQGTYLSENNDVRYRKLEGKELYDFLQTDEGKKKMFHIETDENGNKIGIETNHENLKKLEKVMKHTVYLQRKQNEKGYGFVSTSILINDSESKIELIETIADITVDVEDEVLRKIDKSRIRCALNRLNEDEYSLIYDLFFSDNPQSELMIAKKLHISQQAISKRKKAIFSKLKKYF